MINSAHCAASSQTRPPMSLCRDASHGMAQCATLIAPYSLQSFPDFASAPSGLLQLLRLRPGLATDALRLLATLLDLAEGAPEADIADPDYGARITDAVGLQGHGGRVVGAESAYKPRRQHGGGDRFQLPAAQLPFRRGDLELLKMIVEHERNLGDAARQTAIHEPGAEFPISQREGVGRGPASDKEGEASDAFALESKRMSPREHRLASPQDRDPAAAVGWNLRRFLVGQRRTRGSLDHRRRSRDLDVQIELHAPQLLAAQRPHRFPRLQPQRQANLFDLTAHLCSVVHDRADIALNDDQILGRVVRCDSVFATIAKPYLVHQHPGGRRDVALHSPKQRKAAHGLAICAPGNLTVFYRSSGTTLDDTANRGGESEPPDSTSEIKRAEDRSPIGLKN